MSVARDIGSFLADRGFGTPGNDLFFGFMPDSPDCMTGVFEYAGQPSLPTAGIHRPGLQIRVRDTDYEAAAWRIASIHDALSRIGCEGDEEYAGGADIAGTRYFLIAPVQSAFPLGRDNAGRVEFAQNFVAYLRR